MFFMPRKKRRTSDFGERLLKLRKARGLTQVELAEAIDSTQRAISYYENEGKWPPAPVITDLARALDLSTDELLGMKTSSRKRKDPLDDPKTQRAWKKFQQLTELPEKDQRAVVRLINSLLVVKKSRHAS